MVGVVFFWLLDVGGRGCSLSFFIAGFELFYWFLLQVDSLNSPILFICLTSKPSLSFVRQTCSFVRQTRSTLLHVSFFRSSDALFRSSDVFFPLADAFYSTARVVLSFDRINFFPVNCIRFQFSVILFRCGVDFLFVGFILFRCGCFRMFTFRLLTVVSKEMGIMGSNSSI